MNLESLNRAHARLNALYAEFQRKVLEAPVVDGKFKFPSYEEFQREREKIVQEAVDGVNNF